MEKIYWLHARQGVGAVTTGGRDELCYAIARCPADIGDFFQVVPRDTYDEAVLDLRYEDGAWRQ